jgi:hypothetical protein
VAYQKSWTVRVPVLPGDDTDLLLWLMRESAEKTAESYLLRVVEFEYRGTVDPLDIPPRGIKQLGPAYDGCEFREFHVVAEREVPPDA